VLSAIGSLTGLNPGTGEKLWMLTGIAGNSTPTPVPVAEGRFLIGATTGRGESPAGGSTSSNGLVEIRKTDDAWTADYVWRAKRATSSFGSPVAAGNLAYFVNRTGVLYGLDLETGEEKFAERIGDSIWATPLVVDDRVLFFGKNGVTTIVTSTSDFARLGENKAWESEPMPQEQAGPPGASGGTILYGVALSGSRLVIRSGSELICVGR
jgi:outer membrane protein assembly factor BamB